MEDSVTDKIIVVELDDNPQNQVLLIRFSYDKELYKTVRQIENSRWNPQLKSWTVPWNTSLLNEIDLLFKDIATIDYRLLEEKIPTKNYQSRNPYFTELSAEAIKKVELYQRWLKSRRYSENTIKTYNDALMLFLSHYKDQTISSLTNQDIINFNNDHIIKNKLSSSYQNQFVSALKLFFNKIEEKQIQVDLIHRPKRSHSYPNVLSKEEVKKILNAPFNIKHKAMLSITYACGLRCGEVLKLKPADIESKRGLLLIKDAKGKRDRIAPLSQKIVELLRTYYLAYKPKVFLFEGITAGTMYDERSFQYVLKQNVKRAGIQKPVTLHWLRHSFATHLLESGTDLRYIQEILGHKSSRTTEIYTHVSKKSIQNIASPFDDL